MNITDIFKKILKDEEWVKMPDTDYFICRFGLIKKDKWVLQPTASKNLSYNIGKIGKKQIRINSRNMVLDIFQDDSSLVERILARQLSQMHKEQYRKKEREIRFAKLKKENLGSSSKFHLCRRCGKKIRRRWTWCDKCKREMAE